MKATTDGRASALEAALDRAGPVSIDTIAADTMTATGVLLRGIESHPARRGPAARLAIQWADASRQIAARCPSDQAMRLVFPARLATAVLVQLTLAVGDPGHSAHDREIAMALCNMLSVRLPSAVIRHLND